MAVKNEKVFFMISYKPQRGKLVDDGKLIYLATTGKKLFELDKPLIYVDHKGVTWFVPKAFVSDGSSVPLVLWWWSFGVFHVSGVLHDFCYIFGKALQVEDGEIVAVEVDKLTADRLFADLNHTLGLKPWVNRAMFLAVRLFGRGWWNDKFDLRYGSNKEEIAAAFLNLTSQVEGWESEVAAT